MVSTEDIESMMDKSTIVASSAWSQAPLLLFSLPYSLPSAENWKQGCKLKLKFEISQNFKL
jgi:hypothetical protein